jgi:hypothetical protein
MNSKTSSGKSRPKDYIKIVLEGKGNSGYIGTLAVTASDKQVTSAAHIN